MSNIVNYKKISNICDLFEYQLIKNPDQKFLFSVKENKWEGKTFNELSKNISKVIYFLKKKGVKSGDRILLISDNRIEWFIFDMAIMSIGAITVPCFSTNNVADNKFIIEDCKPKLIIIENIETYKKNENILKKAKNRLLIIDSTKKKFLDSYYEIINDQNRKYNINKYIKKEDISSIIYTSGTSGKPKGVMLSHSSIIHNCSAAFKLLSNFNISNEKFLSFLPLSHSYERMAGLYFPLSIGAQIYYCEGLDKINKNFIEVKPTIVTAVPRFYENIYKKIKFKIENSGPIVKYFFHKSIKLFNESKLRKPRFYEKIMNLFLFFVFKRKIQNIFGGSLKTFVSGGAALNPIVGDFFLSMGINILQGYGQTESSPLISCNDFDTNDTTTVGKPVMDVDLKISKEGEILVKGPNVMLGYWNNKTLTKKTIKNNWLYTGDLGSIDTLDRLKIVGRKKDLIVTSGGDNISPTKIENILTSYSQISQAVIFGNNRPYLIAIIVCEQKVRQTQIKEIINLVNKSLNIPEKIRKFILVDELFTYKNGLLTQTLKIKRKNVIEQYYKEINSLY